LLEGNAIVNAALMAHNQVYKENSTKNIDVRGGSSAIIASQSDSILNVFSTGNCRAYLVRNGKMDLIAKEDSFSSTSSVDYFKSQSNLPKSGFGLFKELHFELKEYKILPGDQFVFLTDGVYGPLDDTEIVANVHNQSVEGKERISRLFQMANNKGNLDNQTVMILEF
jgi:serine/threonine protein phosphatase PrpC